MTKLITKKEADTIKNTATSPEHLMQLIEQLLLTKGVKLCLKSYPSLFNDTISNSHNAPTGYVQNWIRKPELPKGYPGWKGFYKGYIKNLKNQKRITFSDLSSHLPFIRTGSGSLGDCFSIEGMIFVYDFPLIEKEYINKNPTKDLDEKTQCYIHTIKEYSLEYTDKRECYINENPEMQHLKKLNESWNEIKTKIVNAQLNISNKLKEEYNNKYGKNLPLPPFILEGNNVIADVRKECNFNAPYAHVDLEDLYNKVEKLSVQITDYIKTHPEKII